MPQMSQVLREHAIGMLTAGMSTRAVARELSVHFSTISHLQRRFREFGITSNWPHNRRPRVTTQAQEPPGQLLQQSVCITKSFLHKLSETVSGKLICMLVILIGVSTWLQFVVVTNLSGQMVTFDDVWHFGEEFSSRMNPGFHCTGQMADSVYGVVWVSGFAAVNVEDQVAHGGDGVMVWAGVCYWQRTQVHFIDCILNAQRYRDEILRPIVEPFIHEHHLMLQDDNARPYVARICTQFLWVQLMKNGGKNRSVAFIILFSMYIYIYILVA